MPFLIYGFKPYGGYPDNVTERSLALLPAGGSIVKQVFDVRFDARMFQDVLERVQPDLILGLGQHPRARKLRIERKAVNLHVRPGEGEIPIRPAGPGARHANLRLPRSGDTTVTYDAGTYVCNYSMYLMGEYCDAHRARFGFLHVPREMAPASVRAYLGRVIEDVRAATAARSGALTRERGR